MRPLVSALRPLHVHTKRHETGTGSLVFHLFALFAFNFINSFFPKKLFRLLPGVRLLILKSLLFKKKKKIIILQNSNKTIIGVWKVGQYYLSHTNKSWYWSLQTPIIAYYYFSYKTPILWLVEGISRAAPQILILGSYSWYWAVLHLEWPTNLHVPVIVRYCIETHVKSVRLSVSALRPWHVHTERQETSTSFLVFHLFVLFPSNFIFNSFSPKTIRLLSDVRLHIILTFTNYYFEVLNCSALKISTLKFLPFCRNMTNCS